MPRLQFLPLVEARAWFSLSRAELELVDKGAVDVDYDRLDDAAWGGSRWREHGRLHWPQAGITDRRVDAAPPCR